MISFLFRLFAFLLVISVIALLLFRGAAAIREWSDVDMPPDGQMITIPSGRIHVQSAGPQTGTPILLAHGTAAWSGFWSREITLLGGQGYRVHAFDMPPFGFSDRARDGDYSRTTQAQRILDLIDAMSIRPILVAHSFGAAAASEAVLMQPDAFAGFVIIDGAIGMMPAPAVTRMPAPLRPRTLREAAVSLTMTNPLVTGVLLRGLLFNKNAITDEHLATLRLPLARTGSTSAYADWLPSLLSPSPTALSRDPNNYRNLMLPVEIIWGDKDTVTPPTQAEALAIALGQGPVSYLENVGHIPHIEAPAAFDAALLAALGRITDQAR